MPPMKRAVNGLDIFCVSSGQRQAYVAYDKSIIYYIYNVI